VSALGGPVTLVWRPGCASCAAAKEFLLVNGIPFESVNPVDAKGAERWAQLGSPRVPSIVFGGRTTAIYHVSQVASLLGLASPEGREALRLGWDLTAVVEAWSEQLVGIGWDLMWSPTPSRGRSIRNLTVNVHEPLHEMIVAWESGVFTWDTDQDEHRAGRFDDADQLRAYAASRTAEWIAFLMDLDAELGRRDPEVQAGEERLAFSALLDAQRFHAAFHYRQLRTFLAQCGAAPAGSLDLAHLQGLRLPEPVF
jgi:glutaredoxin